MKKYLIILLAAFPGLLASGQVNQFKTKEKKSGAPVIDLPAAHLQTVSAGRTAAPFSASQIKTLVQPVIAGSKEQATQIIRHKGRTVFIEKESRKQKQRRKRGSTGSWMRQKRIPALIIRGSHSR